MFLTPSPLYFGTPLTFKNKNCLNHLNFFQVPITDFFGSVRSVQLTTSVLELPEATADDNSVTSPAKINEHCHKEGCDNKAEPVIYSYSSPLPILDEIGLS